jgi:hypothetical protein
MPAIKPVCGLHVQTPARLGDRYFCVLRNGGGCGGAG